MKHERVGRNNAYETGVASTEDEVVLLPITPRERRLVQIANTFYNGTLYT
jgi:hypothetical protein